MVWFFVHIKKIIDGMNSGFNDNDIKKESYEFQ